MHDPFPDAVRHRLRSFAQRSWLQLDSVLPVRLTARCPESAADRTHARRGAGDSRYASGASRRARAIERDDAPGAGPQTRYGGHVRHRHGDLHTGGRRPPDRREWDHDDSAWRSGRRRGPERFDAGRFRRAGPGGYRRWAQPHADGVAATAGHAAGPDDGSFLAADLKLDEGNNHSVIKLNIAAANLVTDPTPPPDGFLKVLGVSLELRLSDGTTALKQENPELEGVREFEGVVQSVDLTAQTVTLKDGTIIRIVAGTEFDGREGDGDDHVTGLPAVQDALTAGKTVKAEGRGLVDSTNPLTLDAIRIEFEVEGEELPPPVMMVEFETP